MHDYNSDNWNLEAMLHGLNSSTVLASMLPSFQHHTKVLLAFLLATVAIALYKLMGPLCPNRPMIS